MKNIKRNKEIHLLWDCATARASALDFHPILVRLLLSSEGDTGVVLHVVHSLQQAYLAELIQNDEQQNSELTKQRKTKWRTTKQRITKQRTLQNSEHNKTAIITK